MRHADKPEQTAAEVITAEIARGHLVVSSFTRPHAEGFYTKADTLEVKTKAESAI